MLNRFLVLAGAWMALAATAQTNSFTNSMRWFILPMPHLQDETRLADVKVNPSNLIVPSPRGNDDGYELYHRGQRDFDFIRPVKFSTEPLARAIDSAFQPQVYHVGKTAAFECSVLTAIKRKNPLCLLNYQFLTLSW